MKKGIVALLLSLLSFTSWANQGFDQRPEITMVGTHIRSINSSYTDKDYDLWIKLPQGYKESNVTYPVIYLLDAQWDFTLLISLYGQLHADGNIPPAILVGVTWKGEGVDYDAIRIQDFLPVSNEKNSKNHGAEKFINFFDKELIPTITKEYRASDERVLIGSSFGGWFSLYALFNRPELFNSFLITAPTIELIESYIIKQKQSFYERLNKRKTRLYIAIGDRDSNLVGFNEAVAFLKTNDFKGLTYKSEVFENIGHSAIKGHGTTRGLQYLFASTTYKQHYQRKTKVKL